MTTRDELDERSAPAVSRTLAASSAPLSGKPRMTRRALLGGITGISAGLQVEI
jgi:hypothetical protein